MCKECGGWMLGGKGASHKSLSGISWELVSLLGPGGCQKCTQK